MFVFWITKQMCLWKFLSTLLRVHSCPCDQVSYEYLKSASRFSTGKLRSWLIPRLFINDSLSILHLQKCAKRGEQEGKKQTSQMKAYFALLMCSTFVCATAQQMTQELVWVRAQKPIQKSPCLLSLFLSKLSNIFFYLPHTYALYDIILVEHTSLKRLFYFLRHLCEQDDMLQKGLHSFFSIHTMMTWMWVQGQ